MWIGHLHVFRQCRVLLDHRDREENLVHLEMMYVKCTAHVSTVCGLSLLDGMYRGGMEKMDSEDNLDNLALLERMELLVR